MYDHLNNVVYNKLMDSIVNDYLIKFCGRDPPSSQENGIMVSSYCDYFGSIAYPNVVDCGLKVTKLGTTSVEWEVGIFEEGHDEVRAVASCIHVFVDKKSNRPLPNGMPTEIRTALEKIKKPASKI